MAVGSKSVLNRALIGRSYSSDFPFDVSRQKIREFAEAIGDPSPVYRDIAAARRLGHRDIPAPPTFPSVVSFEVGAKPRRDPALGLDYARVVHGEQRIVAHRPIYAGDILNAVATVDAIEVKGANELLTISCHIQDESGARIGQVISLLVSRGTAR